MANINIGKNLEICRKGAAASKAVQQAKARQRWEDKRPSCLHCGAQWEYKETQRSFYQRKRRYCDSKCAKNHFWGTYQKDLGELNDKLGTRFRFLSELKTKGQVSRASIAKFARISYLDYFDRTSCENCGYNKLICDVAHISPVAEFSEDTELRVINDINNLIGLCKRCHWEFDAGILQKSEIQKKIADRTLIRRAKSREIEDLCLQ